MASKRRIARAFGAVAAFTAGACTGTTQPPIAITHVSVIDVVTGATRSDNTVIITGNRITYAGPAANANVPGDARVLDGRGKFLIPGLWDMLIATRNREGRIILEERPEGGVPFFKSTDSFAAIGRLLNLG